MLSFVFVLFLYGAEIVRKCQVHPVSTMKLCWVEGPSVSGMVSLLLTDLLTWLASLTFLGSPCHHLVSFTVSLIFSGVFFRFLFPSFSLSHGTYWKIALSFLLWCMQLLPPHMFRNVASLTCPLAGNWHLALVCAWCALYIML